MAPSSAGDLPEESDTLSRVTEPVVYAEATAVRRFVDGPQEEFPRPATFLNRIITFAASRLSQRELVSADIRRWLFSSIEVFDDLVDDRRALERVQRETAWILTDVAPPDSDVWSGECKFAEGGVPIVVCYKETLASRLPAAAFDIAWQGAMDHFVGHLYPYFAGAPAAHEYGEEVACRYQHLAAQARARKDRRYRLVTWLMPLTYLLHKRIPLSNYERLPAVGGPPPQQPAEPPE